MHSRESAENVKELKPFNSANCQSLLRLARARGFTRHVSQTTATQPWSSSIHIQWLDIFLVTQIAIKKSCDLSGSCRRTHSLAAHQPSHLLSDCTTHWFCCVFILFVVAGDELSLFAAYLSQNFIRRYRWRILNTSSWLLFLILLVVFFFLKLDENVWLLWRL